MAWSGVAAAVFPLLRLDPLVARFQLPFGTDALEQLIPSKPMTRSIRQRLAAEAFRRRDAEHA